MVEVQKQCNFEHTLAIRAKGNYNIKQKVTLQTFIQEVLGFEPQLGHQLS
jgi:hypothetical protein